MAGGAAAGVAPLLRVEGGGDGAVGMAGGDAAGASAGVAPLLRAEGGGDGTVGMAGEAAAIPSDRESERQCRLSTRVSLSGREAIRARSFGPDAVGPGPINEKWRIFRLVRCVLLLFPGPV
jgi:hypothetical protein